MKKLSDIIEFIDYKRILGSTDREIKNICYDSRNCSQGSLFTAIRGYSTDGHKYIPGALEKGAEIIVCEKFDYDAALSERVTVVIVENARKALAELSHALYEYPSKHLKIIGVTGTNGKTTVTYLIKDILQKAGKKTGLIGTTGIITGEDIVPAAHTTPESLELCRIFHKMIQENVEYVVLEVSSHALKQHRVDGIEFEAAVFTNLTHDHLDYHTTIEDYARSKKRLFEMLRSDNHAVVFESEHTAYMLEGIKAKTVTCGRSREFDFIIKEESITSKGSVFKLLSGKYEIDRQLEIPLPGRFNIENFTLAAACSIALGIDKDTILNNAGTLQGAPGRMQIIKLKSGASGIVDYAHSPDALTKALKTCLEMIEDKSDEKGKILCVFGCGGDRDKEKRPIMGASAAKLADYVILTDDNPRTEKSERILEDIYRGIPQEYKYKVLLLSNRHEAISYGAGIAEKGDVLLVAGKGHEKYQICGLKRMYFDDAEELSKFT